MTAPTDAATIAALAAQLDTTPADLLAHAAESVRAPTETPSLTTEQARDLAAKWAWWQDGGGVDTERPESLAAHEGGVFWVRRLLEMRFPDTDRGQLFAWVRARMERDAQSCDDKPDNWREVLAHGVGSELGGCFGPGAPGWHSRALDLCHLSGWPS